MFCESSDINKVAIENVPSILVHFVQRIITRITRFWSILIYI